MRPRFHLIASVLTGHPIFRAGVVAGRVGSCRAAIAKSLHRRRGGKRRHRRKRALIPSLRTPYDEPVRVAWSVIVLMLAQLAIAAPASAGDGKPMLRRGIELYREASYAESVAMLEHARARGGLEPAERVECSFYLGAGYVALGSAAAARRELKQVLRDAPDYELPQYTSPKVAAMFREVQGRDRECAAPEAAAARAARRRARAALRGVAHRRACVRRRRVALARADGLARGAAPARG